MADKTGKREDDVIVPKEKEDLMTGKEVGASGYLTKPFYAKDLYREVERLLAEARDRPGRAAAQAHGDTTGRQDQLPRRKLAQDPDDVLSVPPGLHGILVTVLEHLLEVLQGAGPSRRGRVSSTRRRSGKARPSLPVCCTV